MGRKIVVIRRRRKRSPPFSGVRRRRPDEVNILLLLWSWALVPVLGLFLFWALDTSLPWVDKGACRSSFFVMLPVALVSWLACAIDIRDCRRERRRSEDD